MKTAQHVIRSRPSRVKTIGEAFEELHTMLSEISIFDTPQVEIHAHLQTSSGVIHFRVEDGLLTVTQELF